MKTSEHRDYMGIDQHGTTYHDLGPHPRKGLLEKLGSKHASKMYVDKKDGTSVHIGYIVRGLWVTVYEVRRMEEPA